MYLLILLIPYGLNLCLEIKGNKNFPNLNWFWFTESAFVKYQGEFFLNSKELQINME